MGHYADVSSLEADRKHTIELSLARLDPGHFQGLFFDIVEAEYKGRIFGLLAQRHV